MVGVDGGVASAASCKGIVCLVHAGVDGGRVDTIREDRERGMGCQSWVSSHKKTHLKRLEPTPILVPL